MKISTNFSPPSEKRWLIKWLQKEKTTQKAEALIAFFYTKSAKKRNPWQSEARKINTAQILMDSTVLYSRKYSFLLSRLLPIWSTNFLKTGFSELLKESRNYSTVLKRRSQSCWKLQTNQFAANNRKTDWETVSEKKAKIFGKVQISKQKLIWVSAKKVHCWSLCIFYWERQARLGGWYYRN